jgi:Flp pilus assembly protein TadD
LELLIVRKERIQFGSAVLRLSPKNARAHYKLGIALVSRERKTEAIEAFQKARSLFEQQGQADDARKAEAALKEIKPN